ncbi:MAG: hypothetical protein J0M26_28745 [Planctomycetes bacterium]|nr:hypothetical protein [Planctomycetota bacterium]
MSIDNEILQSRNNLSKTNPKLNWAVLAAMLVSVWAVLSFPLVIDVLPNELLFLDEDASDELKAFAFARTARAYWANSITNFALAGLILGSASQFVVRISNPKWKLQFQLMLVGVLCGTFACIMGTVVRHFLDGLVGGAGTSSITSIAADMIVSSIPGVFLSAPLALAFRNFESSRGIPIGILVGAAFGGCLTPVFIAIATSTGVISSFASTESFPLIGSGPIAIWLLCLIVFASLLCIRSTRASTQLLPR